MSGTIFFICPCSLISYYDGKKNSETKEGERVVSKSRLVMNMFFRILLRQVLLPLQVRLHQKLQGCRELRGNPVAGRIWKQVHSTQLQRLK